MLSERRRSAEQRFAATGVRVAALGDLHARLRPGAAPFVLPDLDAAADLLLVAGDITETGLLSELDAAIARLAEATAPVVAVLGNHDLRALRRAAFRGALERAGVIVLDGDAVVIETAAGVRVGVAGVCGCGGGFWPAAGPERFPSRAMKALALRARRETARLDAALAALRGDVDVLVALTHFAPTASTLGREPLTKYWMLGNAELGAVIDRHPVDLAIHGHAHLGSPAGWTAGGVAVRNVALPVVGGVAVFDLSDARSIRLANEASTLRGAL
ncbi:MAG TPA: metallophosphoesterase, partial [Thermomicrobiales bacterium]|nr:metallophosphoesterase [Thermomicrobiales bacterium]